MPWLVHGDHAACLFPQSERVRSRPQLQRMGSSLESSEHPEALAHGLQGLKGCGGCLGI